MTESSSRARVRRATIVAVMVVCGTLVGLPDRPATASTVCDPSYRPGTHQYLVAGDFGLPLWLGIDQTYAGDNSTTGPGYIRVCYGTGSPDNPKVLGGVVGVGRFDDYWGNHTLAFTEADTNATVSAPTSYAGADPRLRQWIDADGVHFLGLEIGAGYCVGCSTYTPPTYGAAGIEIILEQAPAGPGGVRGAYTIYTACAHINGVWVVPCTYQHDQPTGVTTTGASPLVVGGPGPCIEGNCLPMAGYVGTTGQQLGTLWVAGTPIAVNGLRSCVYWASPTPCP
jgi:hypothetical protein